MIPLLFTSCEPVEQTTGHVMLFEEEAGSWEKLPAKKEGNTWYVDVGFWKTELVEISHSGGVVDSVIYTKWKATSGKETDALNIYFGDGDVIKSEDSKWN